MTTTSDDSAAVWQRLRMTAAPVGPMSVERRSAAIRDAVGDLLSRIVPKSLAALDQISGDLREGDQPRGHSPSWMPADRVEETRACIRVAAESIRSAAAILADGAVVYQSVHALKEAAHVAQMRVSGIAFPANESYRALTGLEYTSDDLATALSQLARAAEKPLDECIL